jgi:hypothetical protein
MLLLLLLGLSLVVDGGGGDDLCRGHGGHGLQGAVPLVVVLQQQTTWRMHAPHLGGREGETREGRGDREGITKHTRIQVGAGKGGGYLTTSTITAATCHGGCCVVVGCCGVVVVVGGHKRGS